LTLINLIQSGNYFTILPHLASLTLTKKQQALQLKDLAGGTPVRQVGLVTHRSQIKAPIDGIISELVMEAVPNNLLGNDLKNGRVVPPV
jgi:mannose/fructose-specific phosphotransferase system component IIA